MDAKQQAIIAMIEKTKECLTEAQKGIEDGNFQVGADCVFAAKLFLEPIGNDVRKLYDAQQKSKS